VGKMQEVAHYVLPCSKEKCGNPVDSMLSFLVVVTESGSSFRAIVAGSLFFVILLHFIADFSSAFIWRIS